MTLSSEQLSFLARFAKSPEGLFLVALYEAELQELDIKLRKATGEEIYRAQGRAQQLDEIIGRVKDAKLKASLGTPTTQRVVSGFEV